MTEQEQFEKIKEACLSEGGKLLLEQILEHKEACDTIKVTPLTVEAMFNRHGYVEALEWLSGLIVQYQTLQAEDLDIQD